MQMRKDVTFNEALSYWIKLGFINFGGPTGQIAIMHRELVEEKRWISEEQFLRALNFCMLLPGPEAQQLATYVGWRLHGIWGGIVAGSFFVIPSIFVLLFLGWLAAAHSDVPAIAGLLYGFQPVVIAIVAAAVIRIGQRALYHAALVAFAAAAFIAMYFLSIPFPLVIAAAAAGGLILQRWQPTIFQPRGHAAAATSSSNPVESSPYKYPPLSRALKIAVIFFILWAIPVTSLWLWRGASDVLVQEALFFTKAAFVTFGGAYSVLSYIAAAAVNDYGWLSASQMVQGLGLAESTPGPLIMVTQYIGFLGAWKFHDGFDPLFYGVLGALATTYVTFLPCFFFIFVGAPYIEALAGNRSLQAALTGVTSAVVGVILNLAVFFASHVLLPTKGSLDSFALVMAIASFLVLWRFKVPIHFLVPAGAVIGMAWSLFMK
ncbi:chromate efflux transporter [Candidatus Acetothermia bacterium]|nr:chromate efflux transporter [Candidatus Acetothermia bacterium]